MENKNIKNTRELIAAYDAMEKTQKNGLTEKQLARREELKRQLEVALKPRGQRLEERLAHLKSSKAKPELIARAQAALEKQQQRDRKPRALTGVKMPAEAIAQLTALAAKKNISIGDYLVTVVNTLTSKKQAA